jgi:hypothetical protein
LCPSICGQVWQWLAVGLWLSLCTSICGQVWQWLAVGLSPTTSHCQTWPHIEVHKDNHSPTASHCQTWPHIEVHKDNHSPKTRLAVGLWLSLCTSICGQVWHWLAVGLWLSLCTSICGR